MTSGTHSPESGQTFTSEIQQQQRSCDAKAQGLIMCKVEVDQIDGPKVDGGAASVVPAAAGATERAIAATAAAAGVAGEDKKPRIGRELKGDHKLQVKVGHRNTTESGESEQMNNHSESKDSSKHEGSSIFEGKVTVTRSSSRRRLGVQPVTPRLEEPRAVRPNRGVKRRYPGEESDENNSSRKRTRVRSMSRVCGPNGQPTAITEIQTRGKVSGGKDWKQRMRGQRRDRQSEVYLCNFEGCEKSFTESSALYNHGRVHGDRPYLCHYEGCSKRFSERSKLKRHFLIHTGEKPFICVYEGCGKAFSLDFNLRSHMKTHTGEYHECPHAGCEKRYCQEYKLRAHICKEHKGTANGKAVVAENGAVVSKEESVISSNDKATKKKQKVEQLQAQKGKLQKCVDGRKKRIQELELELEGETKELNKCEKALRKVMREQEQVEFGGYCVEQELSSDNPGEGELGEVYAEEKEVVMFAHTLPTADQGTRLMDQVVLIQGTGRPLSPSISSSQEPFLMPRLQLNSSQPSGNRPIHFLPYGNSSHSTSDCFYGVGSSKGTAEESHLLNGFSSLQERSPVDDPQAGDGGVSQLFSTDCRDSHTDSFLHEQSSQCEPPVSQLFTYQEQPCLV